MTAETSDAVAREVHALGATIDRLHEWLRDPAMRSHLFRDAAGIWEANIDLEALVQDMRAQWPLKVAE